MGPAAADASAGAPGVGGGAERGLVDGTAGEAMEGSNGRRGRRSPHAVTHATASLNAAGPGGSSAGPGQFSLRFDRTRERLEAVKDAGVTSVFRTGRKG
ncbi:hypothetical protein GCM10009759_63740 [Kitasatospora saccharophila]|uniref:Uncharacterized protein n=1 Tax=Kitasatospora saccharophila TaxID=407973 RepID=A0ABP5JFU3_9ACTN